MNSVLERTIEKGKYIPYFLRGMWQTTDGKKAILIPTCAGILCFLLFLIDRMKWFLALPLALAVGAAVALIRGKRTKGLSILLWCIGPFLSFLVVENMIGNLTLVPFWCALWNPLEIVLNLVWYYLFAWLVFLVIGRRRASAIVSMSVFTVVFGLVDSYFYAFRGRVAFPSDIFGISTAVSVMGEYDFTPSFAQWVGVAVAVVYIVLYALLPREKGRQTPRWWISVLSAALCIGYGVFFFCSPFLKWTGFEGKLWTSLWNTRENGVVLNFTVNIRFSSIEKPDGYEEKLKELGVLVESDPVPAKQPVRPHIIAIMNESLCDLSVLGVETDAPCMPFLYSMTENTVKGNAYVSVLGGHTANTEFEFLTGNSISFLPVGTVAFQMFTRDGDYSLPGQLADLGYYNIAMHPYYASGWNRVAVYERYRFDEQHFIEDFENISYIRDYCSDESDYENVIAAYERHLASENGEKPLFLFNVTMQNHGGYTPNWNGLERTVSLAGDLAGRFESADMYLSLARESDRAFSELITYFEEREEPVVVVMFGDHQPKLTEEFYRAVFGKSTGELSQSESVCLYTVPYVIWANYDIEEGTENFSVNYLSSKLLDVIGFPKTGFQKFLCDAEKQLPVVTRNFFSDDGVRFTGRKEELSGEAQSILSLYGAAQYNGLKENRLRELFFLQ